MPKNKKFLLDLKLFTFPFLSLLGTTDQSVGCLWRNRNRLLALKTFAETNKKKKRKEKKEIKKEREENNW